MNNHSHEAIPENATGVEPNDVAVELRSLWHGIVRDTERVGQLDRQQYWVLAALKCGPMRMTALAEHAQTSQASLTGIIDRMEDHGFVERVRSSEDRRVVEVALSEAGLARMRQAQAVFSERLEATLLPLDESERVEFLRILRKLNANAPCRCSRG